MRSAPLRDPPRPSPEVLYGRCHGDRQRVPAGPHSSPMKGGFMHQQWRTIIEVIAEVSDIVSTLTMLVVIISGRRGGGTPPDRGPQR